MAIKVSYKAMKNPNQSRLGDEKKEKGELCRNKKNCDRKRCPCQFFKMRF